MLSNMQGFGAKSIHYIYDILRANDMSVDDLFNTEEGDLKRLFPEIGRGKFSKASFSHFHQTEMDDDLYDNFQDLKSEGVSVIGLDDERYPKSVLQNMGDGAPPVLYCKGYLPLLNQSGVSIVGARDVGDLEISITKSIAKKLAEHGFNVTSGYAKGVDTSAHLGALEADGTTTMILSFGINYITIKREFKDLNWEKNTLFVTQFAPHERFSGRNAMMRNKLVCAMSRAIIVIKSGPERDQYGKMSGTFDAGKSALEMGIPVFVLDGQGLHPTPQGNIDLIKLGGIKFSDGMDIIRFFEEHAGEESLDINQGKTFGNKPSKPYQTSLFD